METDVSRSFSVRLIHFNLISHRGCVLIAFKNPIHAFNSGIKHVFRLQFVDLKVEESFAESS